MKFGRYLRTHTIPEWNRAYINYRLLKKAIGKAELELEQQDNLSNNDNDNENDTGLGLEGMQRTESPIQQDQEADQDEDETNDRDREGEADDEGNSSRIESQSNRIPGGSRTNSSLSRIEISSSGTQSDTPTANTVEPLFTSSPSKKSKPPSNRVDITPRPALRRFTLSRTPTNLLSPRGGERGDFLTKSGDFNPKRFRTGYGDNTISISELKESLLPAGRRFFTILDTELDRVASFYGEREDEAVKRFDELSLNWKQLNAHKMEYKAAQAAGSKPVPTATSSSREASNGGTTTSDLRSRFDQSKHQLDSASKTVGGILLHGKPEEFLAAKSKLKLATFEYYRSLTMLKSYKVLNRTGFSKALKKFEKATRISCSKIYSQKIDQMNFVASPRLEELISRTEDAFTSTFEHGDRKKALGRLRMDGDDEKMHHFSTWRSGLYFGIGIPLLLMGLVQCGRAETAIRIPYLNSLLQLFGAMFLPILFTGLFFFNLGSWHRARVNYVLIFELDVRTRMDYHQFLEVASFLFFVYSICFWASLNNMFADKISPEVYPAVFFGIALVIMLMPLPILLPSARWWMVKSFTRVISAGLVKVEFRDFFLADEFNSLSYCMYNLGFFVCTYRHGWSNDVANYCGTNHTWTSPVLAALPAFWRLGQSIRRYLDSDGLNIHALNSGKYTATIVYYFVYFSWRINGSQRDWLFAFWIVVSIINSTYTATWDILMDWNLGRKNSKYWMLRPELVFTTHWLYYAAIVVDIILRFSWVMYLSTSMNLSTQLRGYMLAVLEIFRRIMWNALRVESEHVGNVDGYRVTRDIALPYLPHIRVSDSPEDQEELLEDGTKKSKFFGFFHKLHIDMMEELKPITSISLPNIGYKSRGNGKRRASTTGEMDYGKKSRGTAPESSTPASESDGEVDSATDIEAANHTRLPNMEEIGKKQGKMIP